MIIKKLQYLRTDHKQVPTSNPLDEMIGSHHNSEMETVSEGIAYTVTDRTESYSGQNIIISERIGIKTNTKAKAQQIADIEDGSFTYHDFTCKRPNVDDKYIYNYEFINYENWTTQTNEMNLPSGLLWDYLEYFGSGYILEDDIRNIGPEGFGVKSSTHHRVSARLGDEDNDIFGFCPQKI